MKRLAMLVTLLLLLAGCTQAPQATPTEPAEPPPPPTATPIPPTEVPEPTETKAPEPTATPTEAPPTPLPEGVLFRDDFDGALQPGWTWINEDPDRWSFEDGWLTLVADDFAFYMDNAFGMVNFLSREVPEGEFVISAHIKADPNVNFQQAAIYIYEDENNYIALNTGYCDICAPGGPGYFMETYIDNNPFENAYALNRNAADTDVYLRLVNQGGSVTGYYATTPGDWQRAGAFGNYFEFKYVGLGTTNSTTDDVPDLISQFDTFEITEP